MWFISFWCLINWLVLTSEAVSRSPKVQPIFAPKDVSARESVRLLCTFSKGSVPVQFTWMRDDQPLRTENGVSVENVGTHSSILQFDAIRPDHSANYSCKVANKFGSDSTFAVIAVKGFSILFLMVSISNVFNSVFCHLN